MPSAFSTKLAYVLKYLSISRSQLAAALNVDKSVVGRWMTGAVQPSAHNLTRLTVLVAERVEGFTVLDWDRGIDSLAGLLGVSPETAPRSGTGGGPGAVPLALFDQVLAATNMRGAAYEGFFRSTRPYAGVPGRFIHDHGMIRREAPGLLRLHLYNSGVCVEGWMLLLNEKLFCIGDQLTSGSFVFGIFNGVPSVRADVLDGLVLSTILDVGHTPTSTAIVLERIGDLTGDREADDGRLRSMADLDGVAPPDSVPKALVDHLVRDFGPSQLALGGDWVLRAPIDRSLSRGRKT